MTTTTLAEFSVTQTWQSDRRGPVRWILSHTLRQKFYVLGIFIGGFGNAIGAGLVATYTGQAFDTIIDAGDVTRLGWIAIYLIISQLIRGALMLVRNFCSEVVGQRVERDTRDELYLNMIGKSMSFHDRQSPEI